MKKIKNHNRTNCNADRLGVRLHEIAGARVKTTSYEITQEDCKAFQDKALSNRLLHSKRGKRAIRVV